MADRYVTHPFFVKMKKSDDFVNYPNFNGKYFIALLKEPLKYLYVTIDAYNELSFEELWNIMYNDKYKAGTDYVFSESLSDMIPTINADDIAAIRSVFATTLSQHTSQDIKVQLSQNNISVKTSSTTLYNNSKYIYDVLYDITTENDIDFKLSADGKVCTEIGKVLNFFLETCNGETPITDLMSNIYTLELTYHNEYEVTLSYNLSFTEYVEEAETEEAEEEIETITLSYIPNKCLNVHYSPSARLVNIKDLVGSFVKDLMYQFNSSVQFAYKNSIYFIESAADVNIKINRLINELSNNTYIVNVLDKKGVVLKFNDTEIGLNFEMILEEPIPSVPTTDDIEIVSYASYKQILLPNLIVDYLLNDTYFDEEKTYRANKVLLTTYSNLNKLSSTFTDEELRSLCATFCQLILDLSEIELFQPISTLNGIYTKTLKFYANEGTDEAIETFKMLSSLYVTTSTNTCCSTNSCTNTLNAQYGVSSTNPNCDTAKQYQEYMEKTLKTMLGSTDFYKDWFTLFSEDEQLSINKNLCDNLIRLLTEFKEQGYTLEFSSNKQFTCASVANKESECNYVCIDNYISVLNWVREGQIDINTNKIKIYGQAFGELLPKLMF